MCVVTARGINAMPIMDPLKKTLAQQRRLYMKICRECGARNAASAVKCRKCRSKNLRWKKREIVK
jgi:large subunit ribosomal protein L40e